MKTNQIMQVKLLDGILQIGHKDYFGSLIDLFHIGNQWRNRHGMKIIRHDKWLALTSTKDFIELVSQKINRSAIKTKRGKGGGIWAHLYILLDAAAYLSPELKYEIYDKFVQGKLLEWRDRSGDDFIDLNATIALNAESVLGKPAHLGHYITLSNIIKKRCGVENWNLADKEQLVKRAQIEEFLAKALKAGVVRDWDHLKELAEKV